VGVFNRRNAVTGWLTLKLGKWFVRRKAKRVQWNPIARLRTRKEGKGGKR